MANELVPISQYGLLGSSFYWNRYADYGLTREDLIGLGMKDDQVYVNPEIIPVLLQIDKELQTKGWRLYLKEGYRSKELYELLYERRVKKFGQEMTDKLLNIKDMKHSSGLSIDAAIWDESKNQEVYLRRPNDGPESLIFGFYKNSSDPECQKCQELQEYLIALMTNHGFQLGKKQEYFHFDYTYMFSKSNINKFSEKSKTEAELISDISDTRRKEMVQYGRAKIYDEIDNYLAGDAQHAFKLVNHAPAILDDLIDIKGNKAKLTKAKAILSTSFKGGTIPTSEAWGKHIAELGGILVKMHKEGFNCAERIYDEVLRYWGIEKVNLDRKGQILNKEALDELNQNIGQSVAMQFLHLLTPDLDEDSKKAVAKSYGFAIKLADNLSDMTEDLDREFINVSQEDIDKFDLNIREWGSSDNRVYINTVLARIQQQYAISDEILSKVIKINPNAAKGLELFKKVAHSWLQQVVEKYSSLIDKQS